MQEEENLTAEGSSSHGNLPGPPTSKLDRSRKARRKRILAKQKQRLEKILGRSSGESEEPASEIPMPVLDGPDITERNMPDLDVLDVDVHDVGIHDVRLPDANKRSSVEDEEKSPPFESPFSSENSSRVPLPVLAGFYAISLALIGKKNAIIHGNLSYIAYFLVFEFGVIAINLAMSRDKQRGWAILRNWREMGHISFYLYYILLPVFQMLTHYSLFFIFILVLIQKYYFSDENTVTSNSDDYTITSLD